MEGCMRDDIIRYFPLTPWPCGAQVRTRNYGHPSDPNPASETGRPIWRWCGQCAKSYPGHVQRVRRLGPLTQQLLHRTAACGRAPP